MDGEFIYVPIVSDYKLSCPLIRNVVTGKPQPHGRAWKVRDKRLLVEEVIPKFFGQSKYPSFTRQLSGWGFKRLVRGPDFGCYYHECFLRGHPRLTVLMRRISPGKGRAAVSIAVEPDLYAIAKQFPLHVSHRQGYSSTETKAREARSTSQKAATTDSLLADSLAPTALLNPQREFPAEDGTGRVHTTMLHHHNYPAAGNLYQNLEGYGRSQGGLAPTRNVHQQLYEGFHVQRPHLQSHSHDDLLMFYQMSGNINPYSQLRPESISGIQWQAQDQPIQHISSAAITVPSGSSQNPWCFTAANEDSLNRTPMSIPDQGLNTNTSSIEDSFGDFPFDAIFSDYNRTAWAFIST